MTETWRRIPAHPNHLVSSEGRVKQVSGRLLEGYVDADGYRRVRIDRIERRVHRLVCEAFHGPPPPETECAHYDGQKLNNRADNLRWATRLENYADSKRLGVLKPPPLGRGRPIKYSAETIQEVRDLAAAGVPQRKIAAKFRMNQSYVSQLARGLNRKPENATSAL